MKVAYLVNQYPSVTHSFIRREIAALEARGVTVERHSIRPTRGALPDPSDEAERGRTRPLLEGGVLRLAAALGARAVADPLRFGRALGLAFRLGRRSDRGLGRHLAYLAEACLLRGRLAASGAEHLHAHFGTNPATVALLCHALGGPAWSFTVHGPEEFDRPGQLGLGEKMERAVFVVAVSHYGRSQLCRWSAPEAWARLHVVHCGLDEDFLAAPATPVPAAPRLVCVGRLAGQKGQPFLIEAAARLRAEGLRFEVALVGDGPMRTEIEALIRRLGVEEQVRLLGWSDARGVRDQLRASQALVLPSLAEGLPVAVMEAFALGRPVISTRIAGIPELVRPGENGWLVTPARVDELADAMREALTAPVDQLEALGHAGRERVGREFRAATEAATLERLFCEARGAGEDVATAQPPMPSCTLPEPSHVGR